MKKTWLINIIWKKMEKKVGEAQKLGQSCQKWEKLRKFGKKNWYYMNFDPKKHKKLWNEGNLE